ncbi:MAG: energy transducer TonB [Bacteroidetes bacterium]|nr:energy transducer TonB [Bacteroidota bacterium]
MKLRIFILQNALIALIFLNKCAFSQSDCSNLRQIHIADSLKIDSLQNEIKILKNLLNIDTQETVTIPEKVYKEVHLITDVRASFPGGRDSMIMFINNELKYPQKALKSKAEGKIVLNFIVDSLGKICCIKNNGVKDNFGFEDEAIRIISKMPDWIPAIKDNKPVNSYYQLPITFKYYEE